VVVASVGEAPVGLLVGVELPGRDGAATLLVEELVVRPDHRRQGIGRHLFETAHATAASRDVDAIRLVADGSDEVAIAFCRSIAGRDIPGSPSLRFEVAATT
jgi:ribosomal protein S18 acetylase RimI-like enzyme